MNLGFFLLITYKRPLRRTILQSSLRFFKDALVFIMVAFLFVSENDSTLREVVRTHFHFDLVAGEYLDVMHSHLSRNVGRDFVAVFQLNPEHCIAEGLNNGSVLLYR